VSTAAVPLAVSVRDLDKRFRIPHEHVHTLKERFLHPRRRRTFDRLDALAGVCFDVAAGEAFGIVGRNGSGKSTLLKCLAGIYRIDAGEVWLRGRVAPFIELGVGFNPDLTARDNVLINAIMLGLTPSEARARYDAVIEFAELEDFVDLKLKNYSSGMQVRLAFAVMVQVDADLLLIDEVLAVGDAAFQQKCHETLARMRTKGQTIVLITHDMDAIERFCDRAMLLDHGRLVAIGATSEVTERYTDLNFPEGLRPAGGPGRQGDGSTVFVDAWFEDESGARVGVIEQGRPASFHAVAEAQASIGSPLFGVRLEDGRGLNVFETTATGEEHAGALVPGERIEFAVRFDAVLAPGRYLASPSVARAGEPDGLMDLRRNYTSMMVAGQRRGGGLVELPHQIEVERLGDPTQLPGAGA